MCSTPTGETNAPRIRSRMVNLAGRPRTSRGCAATWSRPGASPARSPTDLNAAILEAAAGSKLGRLVTPSTVNREQAILRHLLRLAEEWGYIAKAPKIRLGREPEGRLRFLSEDEISRLLTACELKGVKSPYLLPVVTVALHTGCGSGRSSA
jgi:integrase